MNENDENKQTALQEKKRRKMQKKITNNKNIQS